MNIKLRPEPFGCIVFDTRNRKHVFVDTGEPVRDLDSPETMSYVAEELGYAEGPVQVELVGGTLGSRLSAPLCLYLEITEYCTLRCAHCYKPDDAAHDGMSKEDFFRLLEEAKSMGIFEVRLCGNEPTTSPIFADICRKAQSLGLFLSLNTSGVMGIRRRRQIVAIKPHQVVVSVDGTRETNDTIRLPGAYDRAVALLRMLQEADIPRRINCVLSKLTVDHIDQVVALAKEVGSGISFIPLRTMGRATPFKESSSLTREGMYKAVQHITELKQQVPEVSLETFFDILGHGFWAHHTMDINVPCPAGKNAFVSANGELYPCDWLRYLGDQYCCGDVRENGLRYLWEHSKTLRGFHSIRRRKCLQCSHYLRTCYGGCWCSYQDSIASGDYEDRLCFVELTGQEYSRIR